MGQLQKNVFTLGEYHNYNIAGNLCNSFAVGELGSTDDFFLIGGEPQEDMPYPLLTGNVLDSEGQVLFRLVRNVLIVNPGHCSKIIGDYIGYEIHDNDGERILKVETKHVDLPETGDQRYLTTISANFYNKNRQLIFQANSDDKSGIITSGTKTAFGFKPNGSCDMVIGFNKDEIKLLNIIVMTHGNITEILTGDINGQEINLDGKALIDVKITNCTITVQHGNFLPMNCTIAHNQINYINEAGNIHWLITGRPPKSK